MVRARYVPMGVYHYCALIYGCIVCVQHKVSGEVTFYMKGADAVMTSIVQYSDWLGEEVYGSIVCWPPRYNTLECKHSYSTKGQVFVNSYS